MIRNWITELPWNHLKGNLFPIRTIPMCEADRNAWERGAESLPSPHHGNQMVCFHHSHAVVLLLCNMTHRLGCSLVYSVVCVLWHCLCTLRHNPTNTAPQPAQGLSLDLHPIMWVWTFQTQTQTWERLLGEDEPCLFGALLQIFMCSWNWFHMSWGQPASADFLIKLNQERQRLYWSLIE